MNRGSRLWVRSGPTSSVGVETELLKTRYDAHVFTFATT